MPKTVVTPSPGFISIAVRMPSDPPASMSDISARFATRSTSARTRRSSSGGRRSPCPPCAVRISLAVAGDDEHPALVACQRRPGALRAGGGRRRPGPRRAIRWAIRADVRDGGSRWLSDHRVREGSAAVLAAAARLTPAVGDVPVTEEFADPRDDLGAVQLDVGHERLVREAAGMPYFRSKRVAPSAVRFVAIFWATVSGDPT